MRKLPPIALLLLFTFLIFTITSFKPAILDITEDSKMEKVVKTLKGLPVYSLISRGAKTVLTNRP